MSIFSQYLEICSVCLYKYFGDFFYLAVLGVRTVHLEFRVALVLAVGLE